MASTMNEFLENALNETKSVPDKHQLKILKDTVKNPAKGQFLGGPTAEEAEKILKQKFGYSDKQIKKLKESVTYADTGIDPQAYTQATKNILDAWIKFQRIYMDEQMAIFGNKGDDKQLRKLRDKIATTHTAYENLLTKHYQMAKKIK